MVWSTNGSADVIDWLADSNALQDCRYKRQVGVWIARSVPCEPRGLTVSHACDPRMHREPGILNRAYVHENRKTESRKTDSGTLSRKPLSRGAPRIRVGAAENVTWEFSQVPLYVLYDCVNI
jgi:hypothetical protein